MKYRRPALSVCVVSLLLFGLRPAAFAQPGAAPSPAASPTAAAPSPAPSPTTAASPASSAGPASPLDIAKSRLDTMLRTGHADPAWFSASFLAQVPASKVDEILASLPTTLGKYRSVEFTTTRFIARFEKGTDDVLLHLDADNKIDGLLFRPPVVSTSSLSEALAGLHPPRGTLSYVLAEEGRPDRAALAASSPMAVASAFKLAVLAALRDEIARGARHWSDVVPLQASWKTLPTGVLRTWPPGTPLTLATYAAEMISISDNTAADGLIRILGQNALARYGGENRPFLTTRELVTLKSRTGTDVRRAYAEAKSGQERRAVLVRVDTLPLPTIAQLDTAPDPSIEWHYSVRDLCRLMGRVADLPLMSINPGVADAAAFRSVAYKGGSDFGVMNMTTMVTTKRGSRVCFSATLNDASGSIDESAFAAAYTAVLQHLEAL